MRIAFFSEVPTFNPIFPNGVSAFIEAISKQLTKLGHTVEIYEGITYFGQKKEQTVAKNITIHRLFSLPLSSYQNFRISLAVGTVLKGINEEVDVVHANGPMNGIAASMVGRKQNCPKIITYHTPSTQYREYCPPFLAPFGTRAFLEWAERTVYNAFDLITTPAAKWKENLIKEGFDAHKIFVLPNCVNIEENNVRITPEYVQKLRDRFELNGKRVVVYVGRMSPEKRIPDIIKLVPKVIKEEPDTHFLMVGKGPYLDQYREMAAHVAPHDITFTGYVSDKDLSNIMQMSSLGLIFAGSAQVFDITLLNYWTNSLAVCARRAGGMGDVIEHSQNGMLFEKCTDACSYIINLLQDQNFCKKIGKNGYQTVKNKYSVEAVTKQLLSLYNLAAHEFHKPGDTIFKHVWRYLTKNQKR